MNFLLSGSLRTLFNSCPTVKTSESRNTQWKSLPLLKGMASAAESSLQVWMCCDYSASSRVLRLPNMLEGCRRKRIKFNTHSSLAKLSQDIWICIMSTEFLILGCKAAILTVCPQKWILVNSVVHNLNWKQCIEEDSLFCLEEAFVKAV